MLTNKNTIMKKLLLVAALGVVGFVSAKEVKIENTEAKKENVKEETKEQKSKVYAWIQIIAPCGAVYYLAADNYSGCTWGDFWDDVDHFNSVKCGSSNQGFQDQYA